jgi:hypothetical protein
LESSASLSAWRDAPGEAGAARAPRPGAETGESRAEEQVLGFRRACCGLRLQG